MSRRRSSATALKASEVVAALGMDSIYSHIGICQADSLAGFLPFLFRGIRNGRGSPYAAPLPGEEGSGGQKWISPKRLGDPLILARRELSTNRESRRGRGLREGGLGRRCLPV